MIKVRSPVTRLVAWFHSDFRKGESVWKKELFIETKQWEKLSDVSTNIHSFIRQDKRKENAMSWKVDQETVRESAHCFFLLFISFHFPHNDKYIVNEEWDGSTTEKRLTVSKLSRITWFWAGVGDYWLLVAEVDFSTCTASTKKPTETKRYGNWRWVKATL